MNTVECREVIISTLRQRGTGQKYSPIRVVTEVYDKDGTIIAEHDPRPETFNKWDLIHFARWVKKMNYNPDAFDERMVFKWLDDPDKQ